jgi:Domain of unknown function (DUF4384)
MSVPPRPDDSDRTVIMPAPTTEATTVVRPGRKRPSVLLIVAWIGLVAAISAGALFFLRERRLAAVPAAPAPQTPAPQTTPQVVLPTHPPAPVAREKAFSPHQMLAEIFEGRNRGHSVTAAADAGAVRIGSSRPGYVYVLAAGADQSVLFVAVLFPSAADTNNRIRPGQTLKLPGSQWPTSTEFLAIVSDEPRDFSATGSIAGKVVCAAATPCSESYGAVAFSSDAVRGRDAARAPAAAPAPAAAQRPPAARPTGAVLKRCSDILERASLGEVLTAEEHTFLRRDCR